MPYVKTKHNELMEFVMQQQHYYTHYSDRFWIQSLDIPPRECAVLVNRKVVKHSCAEYFPFLCERGNFYIINFSMHVYNFLRSAGSYKGGKVPIWHPSPTDTHTPPSPSLFDRFHKTDKVQKRNKFY